MGGQVLLQVVYTAWFPARPKTGWPDWLGGEFDALVWRMTLDETGTPLVLDSMHACGCCHMFFPTPRMQAKPQPSTLDEWTFVPRSLPAAAAGSDVRLRVASRTHDLVRVQLRPAAQPPAGLQPQRHYSLRPGQHLRRRPRADGRHRSLYGPHGLVPGSQRGERYFFWPMGVHDAGAMRQSGRHATAIIGRRHFDEVDLLQRCFVRR